MKPPILSQSYALQRGVRGFTLMELVITMVLMGILAAVAAPRFFNTNDYYARGFHDEVLALLRFAQKTAIAQRRTVCVAFTASTVTLSMATASATSNCAASSGLAGPNGPATVMARTGVSFSPTPVNFNFDGLGQPITGALDAQGQPILAALQTLKIGNAGDILVESVTGNVHD